MDDKVPETPRSITAAIERVSFVDAKMADFPTARLRVEPMVTRREMEAALAELRAQIPDLIAAHMKAARIQVSAPIGISAEKLEKQLARSESRIAAIRARRK